MKLQTVQITNYKSIRDTGQFSINDITCLVGKNEAGKTAILQALHQLNPITPEPEKDFDVVRDYPRSKLIEYRMAVEDGNEPAIVVQASFLLDEEDTESLFEDFGKAILVENTLALSKGYSKQLHVALSVNEEVVVKKLVEQADLPESIAQEVANCQTLEVLASILTPHTTEQRATTLLGKIKPIQAKGLARYIYDEYLIDLTPRFLYFDEYYQMTGEVNVDQLQQRQQQNALLDSDRPMLGLIELARLDLTKLVKSEQTEDITSNLEGTSNYLTQKILPYWSQNKHIQVKFDLREARPKDPIGMQAGRNLWGNIHNTKHSVTTRLSRRSRGFLWFFSFLALFSQQRKKDVPLILLLDEPGLSLHAKAQEDLCKYIETELKPHHQVVYSTHSPFMVDVHNFDRVRIVEDRSMEADGTLPPEEEGTKVHENVWDTTDDSLFPLQGALGYEIYQSLFIGPNTLVVEGVSDLIYIQAISGILESKGREGLSSKWTITPVGGADKIPTFIALIGAQKMTVATLIDLQKKDLPKIENLYKKKLLKKKFVFTYAQFTDGSEADIEDMFETSFYLSLVNAVYQAEITEDDLDGRIPRVLVRIERYLASHPFKDNGQLSHYRPAYYFSQNITTLSEQVDSATLDRFEQAFKELNKLLNKS